MEKHDAVVMGRIDRKVYHFYRSHFVQYCDVVERSQLVEAVEVWEGKLENPPLNIGDTLYINEIDEKVIITDKAKSTLGGYIYWTEHVVETIEDDETEKSRLQANKDYDLYKKSTNIKAEPERGKKWWQFWK